MPRSTRTAFVALIALALAVGCGDEVPPVRGDAGTEDAGVSRRELCRTFAAEMVALTLRCERLNFDLSFENEETARGRFALFCDRFDLPGVTWPSAPFDRCAAALKELRCDVWLATKKLPPACVTPGTYPDGAACAVPDQCAGGFCDATDERGCGTCQKSPRSGDLCVQGRFCDTGYYCNRTVQPPRCYERKSSFARCDADEECARGLYCDTRVRSCDVESYSKQSCTRDAECSADEGWACDPSTQTCAPIVPSTSCRLPRNGTVAVCKAGLYCAANGDCLPLVADGGACKASKECLWPATCMEGTCRMEMSNPACGP
jgi:hypothetical protein